MSSTYVLEMLPSTILDVCGILFVFSVGLLRAFSYLCPINLQEEF